jgi:hypothetical protein
VASIDELRFTATDRTTGSSRKFYNGCNRCLVRHFDVPTLGEVLLFPGLWLDPVSFGDRHETLLHIFTPKVASNLLDLSHLLRLELKAMCFECRLRVVDELLAELRMFDGAANDGADHFVSHLYLRT